MTQTERHSDYHLKIIRDGGHVEVVVWNAKGAPFWGTADHTSTLSLEQMLRSAALAIYQAEGRP